jgi:hypothetical protein
MVDYEGVKARIAAFDARHGACIEDAGWLVFEDGALRELNPLGPLMEPPKDAQALARRKFHYCGLRLREAVARFDDRKERFAQEAKVSLSLRTCGPPSATPEGVETVLAALQDTVRKCQQAHEAAKAALEATKPEHVKDREKQLAANREQHQDVLSRIAKFQV